SPHPRGRDPAGGEADLRDVDPGCTEHLGLGGAEWVDPRVVVPLEDPARLAVTVDDAVDDPTASDRDGLVHGDVTDARLAAPGDDEVTGVVRGLHRLARDDRQRGATAERGGPEEERGETGEDEEDHLGDMAEQPA